MPIGEYTLTITPPSRFKTVRRENIRVVSAVALKIDVELSLGEVTEITQVTAELPAVETVSNTVGTTRVTEEIASLPLAVCRWR